MDFSITMQTKTINRQMLTVYIITHIYIYNNCLHSSLKFITQSELLVMPIIFTEVFPYAHFTCENIGYYTYVWLWYETTTL